MKQSKVNQVYRKREWRGKILTFKNGFKRRWGKALPGKNCGKNSASPPMHSLYFWYSFSKYGTKSCPAKTGLIHWDIAIFLYSKKIYILSRKYSRRQIKLKLCDTTFFSWFFSLPICRLSCRSVYSSNSISLRPFPTFLALDFTYKSKNGITATGKS